MSEKTSPGVRAKRPTPLLLKPLQVSDWPGLFQTLTKLGHDLAKMEFDAAFPGATKALSYVEFKNRPQELAWTLIFRSMTRAVGRILAWCRKKIPVQLARLGIGVDVSRLDAELDNIDVSIDQEFFDRPGASPYVRQVCWRLRGWLIAAGVSDTLADNIIGRVPRDFSVLLSDEWLKNQDQLKDLLPEHRKTPFTPAVEEEFEWAKCAAWLQEQADRRVFDEEFGVLAVYIPLRTYADRDDASKVTRTIGMVEEMLDQWLEAGRADDDVRVVEGDPGAGKSTLARIYAADRFGRTFGTRRWRVLYSPLHHPAFQTERPLAEAVKAYYEDVNVRLQKPLDREATDPTLLILDGLDELSRGGHVGLDVIRTFMAEVVGLKNAWNEGRKDARLLVLLCGRPIAADVAKRVVRRSEAVLYLLPFVIDKKALTQTVDGKTADLSGRTTLLDTDQREEWWDKYATARGRTPSPEAYQDIKKNPVLEPITAQPLLNYLVAYVRENSEGTKLPENLCSIYAVLLRRVYDRGWERTQVPAVDKLEFSEFCSLLEEMAVAAWHAGNTRSIRVSAVQERLTPKQRGRLLELEKKVEDGVLRLLLGFFLRPRGQDRGDELYEFTHKSFAEYLIARRLAGELDRLAQDWQDSGSRRRWNDEHALVEWAKLFGPTRLDDDIVRFVEEEGKRSGEHKVPGWREMLARLLETVVRDGMPMHVMITKIKPEPTFREMDRWALNAEVAMLRGLGVCFSILGVRTRIVGLDSRLEEWVRGRWFHPMTDQSYSFLDLQGADFQGRDLRWANLSGAKLGGANLAKANLAKANLFVASLERANLVGGHLVRANFKQANLSGADLEQANLERANLVGANLSNANLSNANLSNVNLQRANLERANLVGANLSNANLGGANLGGANLTGTNLTGTNLTWANLIGVRGITPEQLLETTGDPAEMMDGHPPENNWRQKLASPRKRVPRKRKTPKLPASNTPTPEPPETAAPG
ncbi:MAG: pentapeptide repeat protein [Gemmataceae bacterium]|nr:pentapeptide repeat protein [Gemmataceae bacterium]